MTLTELPLTVSDGLIFDGYAPCRRSAISSARRPVSSPAESLLSVTIPEFEQYRPERDFNNGFKYRSINSARLSPNLLSN